MQPQQELSKKVQYIHFKINQNYLRWNQSNKFELFSLKSIHQLLWKTKLAKKLGIQRVFHQMINWSYIK